KSEALRRVRHLQGQAVQRAAGVRVVDFVVEYRTCSLGARGERSAGIRQRDPHLVVGALRQLQFARELRQSAVRERGEIDRLRGGEGELLPGGILRTRRRTRIEGDLTQGYPDMLILDGNVAGSRHVRLRLARGERN